MLKLKHTFHNNTNVSGNGVDLSIANKSASGVLVVSCGDLNTNPTATGATLTFYGKPMGTEVFVPIDACKSSDLSFSATGTINEAYIIDTASFEKVRVALSGVVGGKVTVIGEVID